MKYFITCLFILACIALPAPVYAQDTEIVEKTVCLSGTGFPDVATLKDALLTSAKREAVNTFFGEIIDAYTAVKNLVVTSDQIQISSLGFVRIFGDPSYYNGDNLADVCVTIQAYVTDSDRAQFEPVAVNKRLCLADSDFTAEALAALVKKEVVIQTLLEYSPKLESADRTLLPALMQRITYSDSGFLQDTSTYCTTMAGFVIPVEVLAFGTVDSPPEPDPEPTAAPSVKSSTGSASDITQPAADDGVVTLEERYVEDCTTELEFGQIVTCSLEIDGETHSYTFDAEVEDIFVVTMVRVDGDISPAFDVLDKNGNTPYSTSGGGARCKTSNNKVAERSCHAERSGTYTIVVGSSESDTTGSYRLMVQSLTPPALATQIEFGASTIGEIFQLAQYNYYTFDAERDDRFVVSIARVDGDLAPGFSVLDRNGDTPYSTSGGGARCRAEDSRNADATCLAERSGTFTIIVYSSEEDTTGSYRLTLQKQN